jgi:hypothetical protein
MLTKLIATTRKFREYLFKYFSSVGLLSLMNLMQVSYIGDPVLMITVLFIQIIIIVVHMSEFLHQQRRISIGSELNEKKILYEVTLFEEIVSYSDRERS